jgi:hypothetical protein
MPGVNVWRPTTTGERQTSTLRGYQRWRFRQPIESGIKLVSAHRCV